MKDKITVFAPASIANVGCGYDVLGFALEELGDEVTIERTQGPGMKIVQSDSIWEVPTDPKENVVTIAAEALLASQQLTDQGFRFKIKKMVMPGSGLGSSASSSAAAVFGINELLGRPYNKLQLVEFAGEGEKAASGKIHFDNVAASLMGGFILVRDTSPLDIVALSFPKELYVVIAHPQVQIKTADARKILREQISMSNAIIQWANLSGFTAGLLTGDFDLIGRSMKDVVAEPTRSILIPMYSEVKAAAGEAGALGSNIAGSGPAIFSFCKGKKIAEEVKKAVQHVFSSTTIEVAFYLSKVNPRGVELR